MNETLKKILTEHYLSKLIDIQNRMDDDPRLMLEHSLREIKGLLLALGFDDIVSKFSDMNSF